jgi:hypothetical protein
MATMGEFSSLLQLGFGIGIGLSYFRAPVELRSASLGKAVDDEITVIAGVNTAKAQEKRGELSSLKLAFNDEMERLEKWQLPFMIAAITGAAGNWIALIYASLYATDSVTTAGEIGLIILSVIYYLALGLVLEIMAQWRFRDVRLRLAQIRSS